MKKVIAQKNFKINNKEFIKGDEVNGFKYHQIVKLNELGYIEPLSYEDLVLIKRELIKNDKEEQ